ncbi:MAG TPA: DUF3618 domain-containing protein [Marmoricola sp.]|nr:DUF3618 domain-containing protein [Marmoricola sp.]
MSETEISSIESEMEQARARLAATIDQLVYRASPKTIAKREVASVRAFFVDEHGSPRPANIAKVVGGVVGFVAVFVVVRKVVK